MKKISTFVFCSLLAASALRAEVLFQDATNYPYINGSIEGQGQWYGYYPKTLGSDVFVTNNVLLLTSVSTNDSVATPTNGWANSSIYTYASFTINVSQLPSTANGGYFCQFQNNNDTNDCCHLFIDTVGTVVPGTYRLGIANYDTSFTAAPPPGNFTMDLATNTTYTVVVLFDSSGNQNDPLLGSTLWVNPSDQDFENAAGGDNTGPGTGPGFAFGTDTTTSQSLLNLQITQIGFSPYVNAGISNVIAATTFPEVNTTNLPVIGIQPSPGTNYSGNGAIFYSASSGVDLTYQWYNNEGLLADDGVSVFGATSNVLVISNLVSSDVYYFIATDAYGNTVTSSNAPETVIITPTAPFFPASTVAQNLTNNLFQYTGFTNIAYGTGPLFYQWYYAPTNTPTLFSPLPGQNSSGLSLYLSDYTFPGSYYVTVSNSVNGGSIAVGPTNTLTELAPVVATMLQLHSFLEAVSNSYVANIKTTLNINTNNVIAGGYVVDYGGTSSSYTNVLGGNSWSGYGSTYSEFFIEDASGLGTEVFLSGLGSTNGPPVGTYVTVTGKLVVYNGTLEMEPVTQAALAVSNTATPVTLKPRPFNYAFIDVTTNFLGTNVILYTPSLISLTNVYIYANSTGGALNGKLFASNGTTTAYCTIGQYSTTPPVNTNVWEIFTPTYNYGYYHGVVYATNTCDSNTIPSYCYQITGVYENYQGSPEIVMSRYQDFVTTPPSAYNARVTTTNVISGRTILPEANVTWTTQPGSTYSVYTSTNLLSGWTQAAYGLTWYPTNAAYTDTNAVGTKFYKISSP